MSELSAAGFPHGEPASELPFAPETQRSLREQREVYAALDSLGTTAQVGASFMDATPTGVVFSDEIGGAQASQGLF
jgi:hypothetical protein